MTGLDEFGQTFAITSDNAVVVVEVCQRLDGFRWHRTRSGEGAGVVAGGNPRWFT